MNILQIAKTGKRSDPALVCYFPQTAREFRRHAKPFTLNSNLATIKKYVIKIRTPLNTQLQQDYPN